MKGAYFRDQPLSLQVRPFQTEVDQNFTFNQSMSKESVEGRARTRSQVEQELMADARAAAA